MNIEKRTEVLWEFVCASLGCEAAKGAGTHRIAETESAVLRDTTETVEDN